MAEKALGKPTVESKEAFEDRMEAEVKIYEDCYTEKEEM